jgi:hypothetical protein
MLFIATLMLAMTSLLNEHMYAGMYLRRVRHGSVDPRRYWIDLEANMTRYDPDTYDGDFA